MIIINDDNKKQILSENTILRIIGSRTTTPEDNYPRGKLPSRTITPEDNYP